MKVEIGVEMGVEMQNNPVILENYYSFLLSSGCHLKADSEVRVVATLVGVIQFGQLLLFLLNISKISILLIISIFV